MAKRKVKLQFYKTVDGRVLKEGDTFWSISRYTEDGSGVRSGKFKRGDTHPATYSLNQFFFKEENARLFKIGMEAVEGYVNKDIEFCNCETNNEYGCNGDCHGSLDEIRIFTYSDELRRHVPKNEVFDCDDIEIKLLEEAKLKIKAIKVFKKYKENFDKSY